MSNGCYDQSSSSPTAPINNNNSDDKNANDSPFLDGLEFTYEGWENDYEIAVAASQEGERSLQYQTAVHRLLEKQRVHEGDRSHPRLIALDRLATELTYPQGQEDIQNAEQAHFNTYYHSEKNDYFFQSKLEGLRNRQQMYYGYKHGNTTAITTTTTMSQQQEITQLLGPCVICGESPKTHLFDPCGHLCVCQSCADHVMRNPSTAFCPICRVPSAKTIRVYFT